MQFRTHLWTSLLTGVAIYPREPIKVALVTMGGVLIDYDHIVLYALRSGDWSIIGALRYNRYRYLVPRPGDNRPRFGYLRSLLHHPSVILFVNWLAIRYPWFRPIAIGMTLHLFLDHLDYPHRRLAHWRAHGRCERCGATDRQLHTHRLHPSHPFQVLCDECAKEFWRGATERSSV